MDVINWIFKEPWPWYVAGPLIGIVMLSLIYFGKTFGFSSNFRTMCAVSGMGKKASFFNFDWKSQRWNLAFLLGAVLGGFITAWLSGNTTIDLSADTVSALQQLGFTQAGEAYLPSSIFGPEAFTSVRNIIILLAGGLMVGFGSRYAGGCTSGHAITGMSMLQLPSLIAVIGFFIGGLSMVYLLFPVIFS
ncbi:YeeE/YedE family protein [Roseivirga sp. BDSF3-8]|uniref:YeeE/YedE family protein n=1 Tax=Roseivirga sp. BDSF3-8 TaxID=3241598 RepID=UPI0035318249